MWIETAKGELANLTHAQGVRITEEAAESTVETFIEGTIVVLFRGTAEACRAYLAGLRDQLLAAKALLVVPPDVEPQAYGDPNPTPGVKTLVAPVAGEGPPLEFKLTDPEHQKAQFRL